MTGLIIDAVPSPNETYYEALGISMERNEQLCDIIDQCYDETMTYPDAIACISRRVENLHELVYAVFHLGAFAGDKRARLEMLSHLEEAA